MVKISNVANLSLIGASLGVKIRCKWTLSSGFYVHNFFGLEVENLTISNCRHKYFDDAIHVVNGSNFSLSHVSMNTMTYVDEVGSISILNSYIGIIAVNYVRYTNTIGVLIENTRFASLWCQESSIVLRNSTPSSKSGTTGLALHNAVIRIIDCTFEKLFQAIMVVSSNLTFEGHNIISNNTGDRGAAISLINSIINLLPHTHILFENNHAYDVGGAIYSDAIVEGRKMIYCPKNAKMTFTNNTAVFGGTSIYIFGYYYGNVDCDYEQY
jgi:predicted outer membrane repeat protein